MIEGKDKTSTSGQLGQFCKTMDYSQCHSLSAVSAHDNYYMVKVMDYGR